MLLLGSGSVLVVLVEGGKRRCFADGGVGGTTLIFIGAT